MGVWNRSSVSEMTIALVPVVAAPAPTSLVPGVTLEAELSHAERVAYLELAQQIGFAPAALAKEQLAVFLAERQLPTYAYAEVEAHLNRCFGWPKDTVWAQTWGWRPLRQADVGGADLQPYESRLRVDNGAFMFSDPYAAGIPFSVLALVRDVSEAIPSLRFFVSDVPKIVDRKGDPFLAVTCRGLEELIVIAEWDEPTFRSKS